MVKIFKNIKHSLLIKVTCILLLVSIGINIYQQIKVNNFEKDLMNSSGLSMHNHQIMFGNAIPSTPPDAQNIKDSEVLNNIIDGVGVAELYYEYAMVAEQYRGSKKVFADGGFQTKILITDYISELKSFRLKLINKENLTSEYINKEIDIVNDLKVIAEWLNKRSMNNDDSFYGDKDIYDNIYEKLSSNFKLKFDYNK